MSDRLSVAVSPNWPWQGPPLYEYPLKCNALVPNCWFLQLWNSVIMSWLYCRNKDQHLSTVLAALGFPGLSWTVFYAERRALPPLRAEEDLSQGAICLLNVPKTCSKKLIHILAQALLYVYEGGAPSAWGRRGSSRWLDQKTDRKNPVFGPKAGLSLTTLNIPSVSSIYVINITLFLWIFYRMSPRKAWT